MWNKIYEWFVKYDVEIQWFLTGWFANEFFVDFGRGNYIFALVDLLLVVFYIALYKHKG